MPLFTYWDQADQGVLAPHIAHWRETFPDYAVMGPDDARAILAEIAPDAPPLFDRIRLPACRADVARLAGLWRHGGLYVDASARIADESGLRRLLDRQPAIDTVISTRWAPKFEKIMPHNSMIWSRADSPVMRRLLDDALANLRLHDEQEATEGFRPYHVWSLTGPGVMWDALFDTDAADGRLLPRWRDAVVTVFETDNPVERHQFNAYRGDPAAHWSARQEHELLFTPAETAT